ncbi:hypothetical protein EXS54_01515 [Patescibacteria group bacterium]|nr:hypothetical protein [Patescibacteria group bacterium]
MQGGLRLTWKTVIVVMIGVIVLSLLFWSRLYLRNQTIAGDEPHYLEMTYSLIHDGDLDLVNQYGSRECQGFCPGQYDPRGHVPDSDKTAWYSAHGVLLPVLLVPGYLISGLPGVTVTMILLALLTLWLSWKWTEIVTGNRTISLAATGLLAISFSFLMLEGLVFQDLLIASAVLGGLILATRRKQTTWSLAGLGALIGLSPWIHPKMTLVLLTLGVVVLIRNPHRLRTLLLVGLPAVLLGGFFELKYAEWFGTLIPGTSDGNEVSHLFSLSPLFSLPAMFLDETKGLLPPNPVYLLMLVGLPLWYRLARHSLVITLIVIVPTLVITSTLGDWWGGYGSNGRYLMELLPAFLPALAFPFLLWSKPSFKALLGILVIAQLWITATAIGINAPVTTLGQSLPPFSYLEAKSGINLNVFWPTFGSANFFGSYLSLVVDLVALSGLFAYGVMNAKPKTTRDVRSAD